MKTLPQRMCVGCKIKKDKKELIRIIHNKEKEAICIDKTGKMQGRGAYICDNIECLNKAIKSRILERTFETSIKQDIYENLRGVIIDK